MRTGARIVTVVSQAEVAYRQRRLEAYKTSRRLEGISFRSDSEEMDPTELKRRLKMYAMRARRGEPLFQE